MKVRSGLVKSPVEMDHRLLDSNPIELSLGQAYNVAGVTQWGQESQIMAWAEINQSMLTNY